MKLKERLTPYVQAVPKILGFKLLTTIVLAVISSLLMLLSRALLRSTGRVSVSSGDFTFLFTSWQGILLILLGIAVLTVYVVFDCVAIIILSEEILHPKGKSLWEMIKEAVQKIPKFFNLVGVFIVLFIGILSPIIGVGMKISLKTLELSGTTKPKFFSA